MNKVNTYAATRSALLSVPVPEETNTYKPISNQQLIDLISNSLVNCGFKLKSELYTATADGQIANARFAVASVADKEMCLEIAFQNSYNKKISLKFAIGVHVFICDNGCVRGDFGTFKKKHQGAVQEFTPTAITEYIKRAGDIFAVMQKERDQMKQIEVSDRVKAELVGRMLIEEEFIASTQVNVIARNMKHPEFDYGAPNSIWELYQFTTQAMRDIHPTLWMENHIKAHNFFVRESGIVVPSAVIDLPAPGSHPQANLFSPEANERFDNVLANIEE